jgi:hypothetical protein
MRRTIAGAFVLAIAAVGLTIPPAGAAPIYCQGNQTATKTDSGWQCINNGDNTTGSGRHQGNDDKVGKTFP